jgi:L-ribulokinase
VPVQRVINGGGIPQNNAVLNQVYANVLNKPVLVPDGTPTSLGSGIVALTAAGVFPSIEAAQQKLCLPFRTFIPEPKAVEQYELLYQLYRKLYFALGSRNSNAAALGDVLPQLRHIAHQSKTED